MFILSNIHIKNKEIIVNSCAKVCNTYYFLSVFVIGE